MTIFVMIFVLMRVSQCITQPPSRQLKPLQNPITKNVSLIAGSLDACNSIIKSKLDPRIIEPILGTVQTLAAGQFS